MNAIKNKHNILLAINKAIKLCGGQTALAEKLHLTQPAIHKWSKGITDVDGKYVIEIEKITKRQVLCEQMRPDIDWGSIRCSSPQPQEATG